jgi:hypothetical protein
MSDSIFYTIFLIIRTVLLKSVTLQDGKKVLRYQQLFSLPLLQ